MRTFLTKHSSFSQNENALSKIKNNKQLALFACDIARSVLPFWLDHFPDDNIVPESLQITENFIFDIIDYNQLRTARNNIFNSYTYYSTFNAYSCSASAFFDAAYYSLYSAYDSFHARFYATDVVHYASNNKEDQWNFIYQLYLQTFKPNHIIIPKNPIFLELAHEIKNTRNFKLYNVLKDAILDYSNIKIKTPCLGLSNWLLFYLLIK